MSDSDLSDKKQKPLDVRVNELRAQLREQNSQEIAARTGLTYEVGDDGDGYFCLQYWNQRLEIEYPALVALDAESGTPLMSLDQAMLMYYLHNSDGTAASYQWMAFSELPNGAFYTQAFQGYTGEKLLAAFGDNDGMFTHAAQQAGGRSIPFAYVAYAFSVLPGVRLMVACWLGDEDFPTSYRVLFDAAAHHHLSTDACAILGSMLTGKILSASKERNT